MKLIAVLTILILASNACAFEISSNHPGPGETVTLTGNANPGQEVNFQTSFQMSLPVKSGRYEYEANSVDVPQKPNRVAVTAAGVKDLNVGVRIGIWISKGFKATNGAASISQSDVPPGRYDLKVFGEALEGHPSVSLNVMAETAVKADSAGKYSLSMDTSGLANGAYKIESAGETKVIQVGEEMETLPAKQVRVSATPSSISSGSFESASSSGEAVTPEVIFWYAKHVGFDPNNTEQYAEAERNLKNRISGGYWKVIARGDPLTEKAGNCQEEFCLVRGVDACTTCRAEEMMLLSSNKQANETGLNASQQKSLYPAQGKNGEAPGGQNLSGSRQSVKEEKGFISWLKDLLLRILGFYKGG